MSQQNDPTNPPHYRRAHEHPSGVECIEMVRHMPFCLGNAVKYLYRAGHKGSAAEDYRKAAWYLRKQAEDAWQPELLPINREAMTALHRWADADPVVFYVYTSLNVDSPTLAKCCLTDAADRCEQLASEVTP